MSGNRCFWLVHYLYSLTDSLLKGERSQSVHFQHAILWGSRCGHHTGLRVTYLLNPDLSSQIYHPSQPAFVSSILTESLKSQIKVRLCCVCLSDRVRLLEVQWTFSKGLQPLGSQQSFQLLYLLIRSLHQVKPLCYPHQPPFPHQDHPIGSAQDI